MAFECLFGFVPALSTGLKRIVAPAGGGSGSGSQLMNSDGAVHLAAVDGPFGFNWEQ